MSGILRTNQIECISDYKKINADFDFYKISNDAGFVPFGAGFLDMKDDEKIKSIAYDDKNTVFILCNKNSLSKIRLKDNLKNFNEYEHLYIGECRAEDIPQNVLIQLFLNSLANSDDEDLSFNNLTGKFMCYNPMKMKQGIKSFDCLEFNINTDMCVKIVSHRMNSVSLKNMMVFGKRKFHQYPQYRFSFNNHSLKRAFGDELNKSDNYIIKPIKNEKSRTTFFNFKNLKKFSDTKMFALINVFNCFKAKYGEYITISFKTYDISDNLEYKRRYSDKYKSVIEKEVYSHRINLIDRVNNNTSEARLYDIRTEILKQFKDADIKIKNKPSENDINLVYIHNKAYYKDNPEDDIHNEESKNCIIQHFTLEDFSISKASVFTLFKEWIIKKDIADKYISIADWSEFGFSSDMIFIYGISEKIYIMNIHPDGTFDIKQAERTLLNMMEYDELSEYFDDKNTVGLVCDDMKNINLIKNTELTALPYLENIYRILKEEADKIDIPGDMLINEFQALFEESTKESLKSELCSALENINSDMKYSKADILSMFTNKLNRKDVSLKIYEDNGILLRAYLREKEAKELNLSGMLDINYIPISEKTAIYSSGKIGEGIQYDFETGLRIRKIESTEGSKLIFDKLLSLMAVSFIKTGQLTVMPFPFKYLREYAEMH